MHFSQYEEALSARLESMFDRPLSGVGVLRPQNKPKIGRPRGKAGERRDGIRKQSVVEEGLVN